MHPPVTAIVIFRNERAVLGNCLRALDWCDEIIAVNMSSRDGSLRIAEQYADRLFHVDPYPIAEPTRVAAAQYARNDWILLVDPDEVIPEALVNDIASAMRNRPKLGAVSLPMRFYFKGERLTGTVWGTLTWKRRLIHRERCRLLPHCNRLTEMLPGSEELSIPAGFDNHMRHYWSNSYLDLLWKHFRRYAHLEAKAMAAEGKRFGFDVAVRRPIVELRKTLRDFDGWRTGVRGWVLSAIYFGYVVASSWLTLLYQWRVKPQQPETHARLPVLIEDQRVAAGAFRERRRAA